MQTIAKKRDRITSWFTATRLSAVLVALFACAQLFATAHNAAYSDVDHLHNGSPCIIAAAHKASDDGDITPAPSDIEQAVSGPFVEFSVANTPQSIPQVSASIRAPPINS